VALRREHPTWGGRKLKAILEESHPALRFPSSYTINAWLRKKDLVKPRRRRLGPTYVVTPLTPATTPNEVWATDFKGQFRLGNGTLCYPLTASDLASRFILSCEGFDRIDGELVWPIFDRMFREFGLPQVIRSDNGPPFGSHGLAGLSRLSVKWMRLGIRHERIKPGHPEQNGVHERMHRTLKQETARPGKKNLLQQQERFDEFRDEFNDERPHEAIGMRCPSKVYRSSGRAYRGMPELEYPLADDVREVASNGVVCMPDGERFHLAAALARERVGIQEVDDGRWLLVFASMELGHYDEREKRFTPKGGETKNGSGATS